MQLKQMCSRPGEEKEISLNTNTEHQPCGRPSRETQPTWPGYPPDRDPPYSAPSLGTNQRQQSSQHTHLPTPSPQFSYF